MRWTTLVGQIPTAADSGGLVVARTVRIQLLAVPGRLVNRAGTPTLRLPTHWPWAAIFTQALTTLRALPAAVP